MPFYRFRRLFINESDEKDLKRPIKRIGKKGFGLNGTFWFPIKLNDQMRNLNKIILKKSCKTQ